jgi:NAD(P)-dependent dehydrogenase (short-subunit alcohol dehydrogenase family)
LVKTIATEFAKASYYVIVNAIDEEELKRAAEDISKSVDDNNRIVPVAGDISQEKVCTSIIEEAVRRFGRIDVLINNAATGGEPKKVNELTSNDWDEIVDINLKGAFLYTREPVKIIHVRKTEQ